MVGWIYLRVIVRLLECALEAPGSVAGYLDVYRTSGEGESTPEVLCVRPRWRLQD